MIFLSWRNYSQLWFNWTEQYYIYIYKVSKKIYKHFDQYLK